MPRRRKKPAKEDGKPAGVPKGFSLLRTMEGIATIVSSVAVTPDGRSVLCGSYDKTVRIWDLASGRLLRTMEGHTEPVDSVAVTPDGRSILSGSSDKTVRIWDLVSGRLLRTMEGHTEPVNSVAVTPDGQFVLSGSYDNMVGTWDLASGRLLRAMEGHTDSVLSVAVTPDGRSILSGSNDDTVRIWDLASGRLLRTLEGHADAVCSVRATPDGRWVVSSSDDRTARVWDASTGQPLRTLEGHTGQAPGLALSGHLAATDSTDGTAIVWNVGTGHLLATLEVAKPNTRSNERVAFTPDGLSLLTVASRHGREIIQVWEVNWAQLAKSPTARETVRYRNAKVVLVGDTGVGKSGLGAVLAGQPFGPTDSTHGRKVWLFESKRSPLADGESQTREVMLWDLAGQPGYRLVHQLNIDQAVVALVLVDARSETDPLGPAEYWARAIDQARSAVPITKILVVARIDRGGLAISSEALRQFAQKFGFSEKIFQTSAKTGSGLPELAEAIREAIRWDDLEEVTSTRLFTRIKQFLQKQKARGDAALVEKLGTLFEQFGSGTGAKATLAEFRTCIARMEAAGLVEQLRFGALDKANDPEYVLLQPEYIDAYASAAVMTARKDPRGIGEVLESKLLAGEVDLDQQERIPD
jgi:GTPase SAR1 family protein